MCRSFPSLYVLAASAFVLLLVAAPAAAEAPDAAAAADPVGAQACQQPASAVAGGTTAQAQNQGSGGEISGPGAQADCYAQCKDGSYLRCSGSTCNATDTNCSTGTSGSCYGSDTGWKYCNDTCEPTVVCSAWASCANAGGGSVSCDSYGANDCYAIDDCYAYCDGSYHMCPSPSGPCPY